MNGIPKSLLALVAVIALFALGYTLIFWLSNWPVALLPIVLDNLGTGMTLAWSGMILSLIILGFAGPLSKISFKAGKINVEASDDDSSHQSHGSISSISVSSDSDSLPDAGQRQ